MSEIVLNPRSVDVTGVTVYCESEDSKGTDFLRVYLDDRGLLWFDTYGGGTTSTIVLHKETAKRLVETLQGIVDRWTS